jgi:hypothetical protein
MAVPLVKSSNKYQKKTVYLRFGIEIIKVKYVSVKGMMM